MQSLATARPALACLSTPLALVQSLCDKEDILDSTQVMLLAFIRALVGLIPESCDPHSRFGQELRPSPERQ
jgi:hypothetical protein